MAVKPAHLSPRQARGREYEQLARAYLCRQGYQLLDANVRFPVGELDLIALDGPTLCLIEVRARAPGRFGAAADSITAQKRRRMVRAAQWYLQRRRPAWIGPVRFDVVAIDLDARERPSVRLIQNAFYSEGW